MKRATFYLSVFILGVFITLVSACETTPLESCEEEDICAGKTVTACCNEIECYYEYNGIKYGDDAASLARLANDLGCTYTGIAAYETEIKDLILRLESLAEIARIKIE